MNTILIISIFLFAVTALALRRWNRQPQPDELNTFPVSRSFDGLFAEPQVEATRSSRNFDGLFAEQHAEEERRLAHAEAERLLEEERRSLIERAEQGDETALYDAHNLGEDTVYREVLRSLVAQAEGQEEILRSIAEYIVDSRVLRSSGELATAMIGKWGKSLDQRSFADMIYLAALSDDVAIFKRAVEVSMQRFFEGRLPQLSSKNFLATVESAYWMVATEVRYSGSGFLLKQLIAEIRRKLATASRRSA